MPAVILHCSESLSGSKKEGGRGHDIVLSTRSGVPTRPSDLDSLVNGNNNSERTKVTNPTECPWHPGIQCECRYYKL